MGQQAMASRLPGFFALIGLVGCAHIAPPASSPPTADAALARMHATFGCGIAIQANAKIDHFGDAGRIRGDVLLFAARPARLRMDVVSPFGAAIATLTSDGVNFSLADMREKRFFVGPASACNIARLTSVRVPGHVLVNLLRGEAPVLKHDAAGASIVWNTAGYYALTLFGSRATREEIRLVPRKEDWAQPWESQRMRVLDVRVEQQGFVLYHADFEDHEEVVTAGPREDPDNLGPAIPPSGPQCDAQIPRKIHLEVPDPKSDVRFHYEQLDWNPPLPEGTFRAQPPPGMHIEPVTCD